MIQKGKSGAGIHWSETYLKNSEVSRHIEIPEIDIME